MMMNKKQLIDRLKQRGYWQGKINYVKKVIDDFVDNKKKNRYNLTEEDYNKIIKLCERQLKKKEVKKVEKKEEKKKEEKKEEVKPIFKNKKA